MSWTSTWRLMFHFKPLKARQMGFPHPSASPTEVLSNDFCKASFACNMQLSSLACLNTLRAYRPSPGLHPLPVTSSSHQCPDRHTSGEKWASWEWGSWRGRGTGAVRRGKAWLSHTAHQCHSRDADVHSLQGSGCCLLSRPWHQCCVLASFHNSREEAEGWVRKNRKTVLNLLFILKSNVRRLKGSIQPS